MTIRVRDTGPGIAKDVSEHIFDPFFSTKTSHGTGLGLAVAHTIVNNHNGYITLESELGQGAEFTIHLPTVSTKKEFAKATN